MKHKIFAISALALALTACDDNDVTAGNNNVEGTVGIEGIATSGIPFIGTELSASVADANGIVADVNDIESSTVIAYQWMADGIAIAGATSADYIITEAEEGAVITVSAAYTDNDGFDESVLSSETPIVTVAPVNDPATVTITGDTFSGSVLTAEIADTNGTENISVTYVWSRDGVVDTSITTESYTLLETDIGSVFTVQVTFTDNIDAEEDATSAETAVITAPLGDVTRLAQISDTDTGDTGELRLSDFGTLVTGALRFRFSRDNLLSSNFPESNVPDPVTGETATPASFLGIFGSSTSSQDAFIDLRMDNNGILSIRNADDENGTQNIDIDETFEDGVFTEVLVTWDATNASVANAINPQITVAIDGQLITDIPFDSPAFESTNGPDNNGNPRGLPNVVDGVRTIQWRMGDTDEIVIGNFRIDDIVIYSDVAATTEVFSEDFEAIAIDTELGQNTVLTGGTFTTSTQEAVVVQFVEGAEAIDEPGSVAISGPTIVGSNLTATVTDNNGVVANEITYQWMREGVNIDGATASTYTLVDADLGQTITVTVNYTDVDGFDAVDVLSPATVAIEAPVVVDLSAGISGLAASITDLTDSTNGNDTGEVRIDLGGINDGILNGSLSFVFLADQIIRNDTGGNDGDVGLTIYADSSTRDDSIVDVTFTNDGNINFINLVDTTGASVPNISGGYTPNQQTFVELTWVTDGLVAPAVTVTINGIQVASGISSGPVVGAANEDSSAEDNVNHGLIVFQLAVNGSSTSTDDFALIDNIVITNETTGVDEVNVTFDDGTFNVGDVLDGGTAAFDSDTGTAIAPFNNNSEDATIVDSSTLLPSSSDTISGQAVSIVDTDTGDTGELRFDPSSDILVGSASVVINRDAALTRTDGDNTGGATNSITLFGTDTSNRNAVVRVVFDNDGNVDVLNLDTAGENTSTYDPAVDQFVEFTWATPSDGVTNPSVTVSVNGQQIAQGTTTLDSADDRIIPASVLVGVGTIQLTVGGSSATNSGGVLVDNISVVDDNDATNSFSDDFEGFATGAVLDGTDEADGTVDPYRNNSSEATVVDSSL